ncbi:MAG TPA: glutathione S-transferase family protein [Rhodanobacteraceae bacterium]|nr:glutathione S-transferase family protein [Rhodanobacteraceae bacterium]
MIAPRPRLYAHPFSSYCQKALTALYENATPFEYRHLEDPAASAELAALWPIKRFPVLVDGDRTVLEATCVIEYLDLHHPGPVKLIPDDRDAALEVRMLDRFFDNYVSTPQQKLVSDALRPADARDPYGVTEARALLERAYAWLDAHLDGRTWAAGGAFSLADCAAAPFLFYADWSHPIDARHARVRAYRERLLARQSFRRAVDEARPYRHYFPLGAPARD